MPKEGRIVCSVPRAQRADGSKRSIGCAVLPASVPHVLIVRCDEVIEPVEGEKLFPRIHAYPDTQITSNTAVDSVMVLDISCSVALLIYSMENSTVSGQLLENHAALAARDNGIERTVGADGCA